MQRKLVQRVRALYLVAGMLLLPVTAAAQNAIVAIGAVLDEFHAAAAAGDWPRYFDLMHADGIFLGTDASERWTRTEFEAYAAGRSGWTYTPRSRNVALTPDGNSAWFDELLDSSSYGTSRGTGVLVRTVDGWKIAQYHLTFPVPNPLARQVTDAIKAFEAQSPPQ